MNTLFEIATQDQLQRYAAVIVKCGLGQGQGIKRGDKVVVDYNQGSAALVPYLQRVITKAGGHMLHDASFEFARASSVEDVLLEHGDQAQLEFVPLDHKRTLYATANHRIKLKCQNDIKPSPLAGTDAAKTRRLANSASTELLREFREKIWGSYTLNYVPTEAMAKEAGVSPAEYWQVIVKGCYLDYPDAVERVRQGQAQAAQEAARLSSLKIASLHIKGEDIDLHFKLEETVRFVSSGGGNVPSFEVFTVPAASSVEGWFKSPYPTLFEQERIAGAHFHFKSGKCVAATAEEGEAALQRMLAVPGMDRLGEFAMTDQRHSLIRTVLPGATLFMENMGGTIHLAFGSAIAKCFVDKVIGPDANECKKHLDFVCSGDCTVTAHLGDGVTRVIYQDGQFTD